MDYAQSSIWLLPSFCLAFSDFRFCSRWLFCLDWPSAFPCFASTLTTQFSLSDANRATDSDNFFLRLPLPV